MHIFLTIKGTAVFCLLHIPRIISKIAFFGTVCSCWFSFFILIVLNLLARVCRHDKMAIWIFTW